MAKQSALDAIKATPPARNRGADSWYHQCKSQDIADQLNEVHAAVQSGELQHNRNHIARQLREMFDLPVSMTTVTRWLNGKEEATTGN